MKSIDKTAPTGTTSDVIGAHCGARTVPDPSFFAATRHRSVVHAPIAHSDRTLSDRSDQSDPSNQSEDIPCYGQIHDGSV